MKKQPHTIQITVNLFGEVLSREFPTTNKGNKESADWLQSIKKDYSEHPFWFNMEKIKHYERLSNNAVSRNAGQNNRRKTGRLTCERKDFLRRNPNIIQPEPLSVTIEHIYSPELIAI